VEEPILILNGIGEASGTEAYPVNNVCFPSVVNDGYAPDGYNLCCVTVLGDAMKLYDGRPNELDSAVRRQLGTWFREDRSAILNDWNLKKIYFIPNAQPGQFNGPTPANVNGGRPSNTFRGKELPPGLFVCGDHMATATLNGALESGSGAGLAAGKHAAKVSNAGVATA
jgi:phytoene dehydrogenase-like protein